MGRQMYVYEIHIEWIDEENNLFHDKFFGRAEDAVEAGQEMIEEIQAGHLGNPGQPNPNKDARIVEVNELGKVAFGT